PSSLTAAETTGVEPAVQPLAAARTPPLTEAEVAQLLADLRGRNREAGERALAMVLEANDPRFISVLIEILRATEIGMPTGIDYASAVSALESLSGEAFGGDWPAWIEWYGNTDLVPPPGFTGWKGELLSFLDPQFAEFLASDAPSRIRVEEIVWGGVAVDGIPALDQAEMISTEQASYLLPEEPVFGIALNGDARAYPLRILDWHEMANDVVGGVPVSLAYCTLCGAAIVYDGRASSGQTYTFGSSGFLYRSNKLMYDRQTRTLWNQLTGEPVLGELAATEVRLSLLPVVLTSWSAWQEQHPDTVVLSLATGFERYYQPGAAYGHYFSSSDTMFPVWQRSEQLQAKDRVYALRLDGVPKAYPVALLVEEGVVNDRIGNTNLVLVATRGRVTVDGNSLQTGQVTYDAGGEVRAFDRGEETFSPGPTPDTLLDSGGREWRITEEGLRSPEGRLAPRVSGHLAYWFGWFAFFPHTEVYRGAGP
ncbi:MAG TPA: DUF3179 domain-containing protein, partial [Gemmatimonadales bacterium]|nr:DUF3179 domain-containing protein [Gemmatimonadales bacterium]